MCERTVSFYFSLQTLAGFGEIESFYDVVDALEEQGIEKCMDVSAITSSLHHMGLHCSTSSKSTFDIGKDILSLNFLVQFHQRKSRNRDLLKEFKLYEVSPHSLCVYVCVCVCVCVCTHAGVSAVDRTYIR